MKFKNAVISIAIALIFVFFIGYGIEVFHDTPEHDTFCPRLWDIQSEEECKEAKGIWRGEKEGLCQNTATCYLQFEKARDRHDLVVFIVALIIGVGGLIGSYFIKQHLVGNGLAGGSILLILYGVMRYWRQANDIVKFVLLGIALAVLIWMAYKKFK